MGDHAESRGEVVVRGVPVRFAVAGEGGQDVLLVHGSGAHRWWWHPVVPHLVAAGRRVISFDLSGHGDSGHRPGYDAEVWGEEVLAVLAATRSERPLVVGHSLGGRLTLLAAAAHPDAFAGVVLLDAPLRPPPTYLAAVAAGRLQRTRRERRYPGRDEITARFRLFPPQPDPPAEVLRTLATHGVREVDGMWTWKHDQGAFPAFYGPDLLAAAATVRLPLSYLYGGSSALVDDDEARFVEAHVPGDVRVVRIAGGHHHLGLDRPAECAAAILGSAGRAMSSDRRGGLKGMDRTSGYADVNGLHMYYEVQGEGSPLVLLHGGVQSIDLSFAGLIPELVGRHRVIGVELQGHGRTADIDRVSTPAALAGDVVALLDHLRIDRAHVLGFSLGAAVTFELAVSHPDRVRSVVPISEPVRPDGMHEDLRDPAEHPTSTRVPTAQDYTDMQETYARLSPHPEHFTDFMAALSQTYAVPAGWSDEQLAGITAPTLIVLGDHDFVTVEHGALMKELIPGAQLAVLPGTTHMTATKRLDLLVPLLAAFLD